MNEIRNMAAVKVAADLLTDVNARLLEYREIRKAVAADVKSGKDAAADALAKLDAIIEREATIAALISANVPEHEWDGTSVRLRNVDGEWGQWVDLRGAKGDQPAHEWVETSLRFEQPDGSWGASVDLKGETGDAPAHQWAGTLLSFANPDGSPGTSVDLKGDPGENVTVTVVADDGAFDAANPDATELVVLYA